jgi:hypothetical protein
MKIDWEPTPKKLREFGCFGGFFLFAVLVVSVWLNPRVLNGTGLSFGTLLIGGAGLLLLLGSIAPRLLKPIFIGMSVITFPIGYVVNLVILSILFYGVFTPIAFFFRLIGRDTMERKYEASAQSYWKKVQRQRVPESYYQPF